MNRKISILMFFVMLFSTVSMSLSPITLAENGGGVDEITPIISEDFEGMEISDAWGSKTGTAGGSGNLGGAVASIDDNQVFQLSGGGPGARSTQKEFTPIDNEKVLLNFDWNVGSPASTLGAQLSIEDSTGMRYLTLQYNSNAEMKYGTGGSVATDAAVAINGHNVGSGFNVNDTSYNVEVIIDFVTRKMKLTMTALNDSSQTETITDIPFSEDTIYDNSVGKIQFNLARAAGASTSWTTWIDNFNVYGFDADGSEIPEVNKSELEDLIVVAKAISNDEDEYTESSYSALLMAITTAEAALGTIINESELNGAINALQSVIHALVTTGCPISNCADYTEVMFENFEGLEIGDEWGTKLGTAGGTGYLGRKVVSIDGNQVFELSGGGAGPRSTLKEFTPINSQKVLLNFDWNVGSPASKIGGQLSIEDSAGLRYLTLQYNSNTEMIYGTGSSAEDKAIVGLDVGTGFNVNNTTYNVEVIIDFEMSTIDLTITALNDSNKTTTITEIPFSEDTNYEKKDVGKIQFNLPRDGGITTSWTTWIDDFKLYRSKEAPAIPTELTITRTTASEVALAWDAVENADHYRIYRSTAGSATVTDLGETAANEYVDQLVVEGDIYSYYVTSVGGDGLESAPSEIVTTDAIPVLTIPLAPENVRVTEVKANLIGLSWTVATNATSYKIMRSNNAASGFVEIGQSSTTSYIDTTSITTVPNFYQIIATNTLGGSPASVTVESRVYVPPITLPEGDVIRIDFGPGEVADQYFRVEASTAYSAEIKYGFDDPTKVITADRGLTDPLKSDFVMPANTSFKVDLPNGDYRVSLIAGDSTEATEIAIKAEMMQKVQLTTRAAGQYLEMGFDIALVDGQLNLEFSGDAPKLNALTITKLLPRQAGDLPTVYLAGDSTVQTYDPYWEPQAGWGQMIPRFFDNNIIFKNNSIGGRSSKSFIVEGRLDEILRVIKPDDYFLIQFGHNDATISVPERYASPEDYKEYLKTYINGTIQRGAEPILVTPMGRRSFNSETGKFNVSFPEYVDVMKELAVELNVQLVDLSTLSIAYYDSIGPEGSLSVFLHLEPGIYGAFPNGSADDTHFQEYGAIQIARLLAGGINELDSPLSAFVKEIQLPDDVPNAPSGLVAGSISNAGAVLKWDDVVGADIYKIYRKHMSDTDYAMIGTATVPTFTIGGMIDGESYDIYVTAVNGRGESSESTIVSVTTKLALYRYDFGTVGSPVAAGYTQVTLNTLYSVESGYGFTSTAGMDTRDRGSELNDLGRDFIIYYGGQYEFKVDLPNGLYSAKSYSGDLLGSQKTNVNIEGKDYGQVTSGKGSVAEKLYNGIAVRDGQMNFIISGPNANLSGLEITPLMLAPTQLQLIELNVETEQVEVELAWDEVDEASKYRVYRKSMVQSKAELLGETAVASYTDLTADVGFDYTYTVTALDLTGLESVASNTLDISTIDTSVEKAAIPTNLNVQSINKHDVTFTWDSVDAAGMYNVYRSKKEDGVYELVGKTTTATYTDTTITTTIPYYYKVSSVNAGGISELSSSVEVLAITTLYRQMETLTRAPVAVKQDGGNYIAWRLLGLDPASIGFHLYRDGVKVNAEPITGSTNFFDALGTDTSIYSLSTVVNEEEALEEGTFTIWEKQYLSIPLQKPDDSYTKDGQLYSYYAGDASVGDLDGDGEYEIVMLWSPSNSKDNSQAGYTGNIYMDAYKLDGTQLWRINLGPNIRAGAHYTQFMVYDLDGDGRAEVVFKTADGTIDGIGKVIGDASADHRNSSGYVLLGNEYLTVFNGLTGAAVDTVEYDPPRGDVNAWGDGYGNRVDRFLAGVAYLDGERPSVIFSRGYYTRAVLAAYNFENGKLVKLWTFDSDDEGNEAYAGQGNHNLSVADVDGDGFDEIIFGASTIDHDGTGLYSTGFGHGDALHVSDFDPNRPGLEIYQTYEESGSPYGFAVTDAKTGEVVAGKHTGTDVGRGLIADIDPRYVGAEYWSSASWDGSSGTSGTFSVIGNQITTKTPMSINHAVWWDGDLLRELLDHTFKEGVDSYGAPKIDKWNWETEQLDRIYTPVGTRTNNSTKGNPSLQADLFGDWREEVIWASADSTEFQIHTTTDLTEHRIYTLMHDPVYRLSVAWQNVSYNQPPHTGFYLGEGMETPPTPKIFYVSDEIEDPELNILELQELIETASAISNQGGVYTASSYTALGNAIAEATAALETINSGEALASALEALQSAIDSLVLRSDTGTKPGTNPDATDQGSVSQPNQKQMIVSKVEKNDKNQVIINIEADKNEVLFPADAVALDKDTSVRLINDDVILDLTGEVIEQLRSLAKEGALASSRISFKFEEVIGEELADLLTGASNNNSAIITVSGKIFKLSLALIDNDGVEHKLTQFDSALRLSIKIGDNVNPDLMGMYYVREHGELDYVGGEIIDGYIVADVHHFSHYAALEYDKTFNDVAASFWAYDVIRVLSAKHIITGINDSQYAPLREVSRAEFAALIVRSLQLKGSEKSIFKDVSASKWYASDITAAYEAGIIAGYNGDRFAPEASITRQEMAVMMLRAYEYATGQTIELSHSDNFTDQDQVSAWAQDAVNAIHSIGIIEGRNGNIFDPQGNLNRAESAKVIFELLSGI